MKEQERTEEKCRSDYQRDRGRTPQRGDRIVECDLPRHGRDRDHEETDTGIMWPWAPPPPPRVWSLPAEPGPEVTRLRDADNQIWTLYEDGWWRVAQIRRRWGSLLADFGPLTDATPTKETK